MEKTGKKISHVTGVLARSVRIIIENILREGGALQGNKNEDRTAAYCYDRW